MHTIPGWKTVPVERSYEMRVNALVAFNRLENGGQNRDDALDAAFQAMLAAAPTPPASAQDDARDERQPLFWYRPRSDDSYEGPIHNDHIEDVRKQSGAWVPLYAGFSALPKPLYDLRYHGEFVRGWNQCPREVSASVAAPAAGDARLPALNIEAAAKAMAECMDYPWAHMPEQGRATMREHAQTVTRAASQQQEG
ncbi:hypothetical protein M5J07_17755 [Achromobacter mucicolens]|uniref:hypothetical protein n=1 Tax=Achromobacter mucicolens TaxID=1389922 RepID=UPI0020A32BCF|nr:hypothetical protein [Achromobacter mucicolens]MCP2516789.1 hypothetical protein [Achromobacter mucicolens]